MGARIVVNRFALVEIWLTNSLTILTYVWRLTYVWPFSDEPSKTYLNWRCWCPTVSIDLCKGMRLNFLINSSSRLTMYALKGPGQMCEDSMEIVTYWWPEDVFEKSHSHNLIRKIFSRELVDMVRCLKCYFVLISRAFWNHNDIVVRLRSDSSHF